MSAAPATVEDVRTAVWLVQPLHRRTRYQRRPHLVIGDRQRTACGRSHRPVPALTFDLSNGITLERDPRVGDQLVRTPCALCARLVQVAEVAREAPAEPVELPDKVAHLFDALHALGGALVPLVPTTVIGTDDDGVAHFEVDTTRALPADMVATVLYPHTRTAERVRFHS